MQEIKCTECGEILTSGMTECPKCGCPVQTVKETQPIANDRAVQSLPNPKKSSGKNIMPYISLVIGIIILCMGISTVKKEVEIETYEAKNYDVSSAAFGADFYTEIYKASDVIADELNDINSGIESVSNITMNVIETIYFSAGMIITALGLGTIAMSLLGIKKRD